MEIQVVCWLIYWLLLPVSLLAACLFRYNALSLVYFLFLLLLPWFHGPNLHTVQGHTGRFIKALFGTSIIFLLAHVAFQICLHTIPGLDEEIAYNCSKWEVLLRHIGVSRLPVDDAANTSRLLAPDLGVFFVSLIVLCLFNRLPQRKHIISEEHEPVETSPPQDLQEGDREDSNVFETNGNEAERRTPPTEPLSDNETEYDMLCREPSVSNRATLLAAQLRVTAFRFLKDISRFLVIALLGLAGITLPSAFSGVYFVLFIGVCTWWACCFPFSTLGFNALCVMVAFYAAGHLICLYLYQFSYVQDFFPTESIWARLFGFKEIVVRANCTSPDDLELNMDHEWPVYVNPGILLLLYFTMATVLKLQNPSSNVKEKNTSIQFPPVSQHNDNVEMELESWVAPQPSSKDESEQQSLVPKNVMHEGEVENLTVHVIDGSSPHKSACGMQKHQSKDNPLQMFGRRIMQQSYISALIAMMVWSITYHSWLTFVLLLWACLIWIIRARRQFAMLCSPFILLYGLSLCTLQYIWAMDLGPELPDRVGFMSLKQLGLERSMHPCLRLGAMLLFTLTFWLLLRQSVKEKFTRRKAISTPLTEVTIGTEPGRNETRLKVVGELIMSFYAKYWIYVCGGMFIMVSFAGKLVGYKIVYMLLFLLCLSLYQMYYSLWRRLLKVFWWLVVAYTMLVLIIIYTFQFEDFPMYWKNFTGFTEEQLADIGLETFKLSDLFASILIPGFFLLACILQLHYFHRPFMKITDLEHVSLRDSRPISRREPESEAELLQDEEEMDGHEDEQTKPGDNQSDDDYVPSKWGLVMNRLKVLFKKFAEILTQVQSFIWRILELHILKIVAFFNIWVALREPSVMNLVLVVLWCFAMPYSRFRRMASCLSTVWACVIIVCKMLYQLSVVSPIEYSSTCTKPQLNETNLNENDIQLSLLYKEPVDPAIWFGFGKSINILNYIKNHLLVLMLLVFEATVYRHQSHYYRQHQTSPAATEAVFPEASRENLDYGVLCCVKYFVNYCFYKFGLEICFLLTVNVIGQRMNFLVIFHGCWLVVILTRRRRAAIAKIWPKYCLFLVLFLLFQYVLCLGIPPALCIDYPWRWNNAITFNSALIKWFYLPDFFMQPNSKNLIYDFLLLICASQQWKVFEDEKTQEWIQLAGENCDEPNPMRGRTVNPVPNFINCRCYLDMMKVVVFRHLFWFVLAVVFVTGSTRISVFGLGYLMACFYFLLFGNNLLLKSAKARLRLWDCLIMYNVAVIISKNMLSLLSCVFVEQMQSGFCWVIQLFSLVCTVKGYYNPKELRDDNRDCILPVEEAGIIWDSICFFFLLLQRRVFHSYYFLHVTADQKASTRQASRGFELFKASIVKSMNFHQETERKSIAQLKRQMERIWAKQQKYKEGHHSSESKEEHPEQDTDRKQTSKQKKKWWRPWVDHATVLHSGEYYLFESDSEEEEDLLAEEQKPIRQSAFQLAYQAWITNAKSALKQRRQFKKEMRRQAKHKARQDSPHHSGKEDEVTEDVRGKNEDELLEEEDSGKSDIVQRILDILKFLWVLFLAMVDGITQWLNTLTKQYVDTSTVLWIERYLLTHNINQVPCNEIPDDARSEKSESPTVESAIQGADTNEVDEDKGVNGQVDQSHPESSANAFELEELPPIDRETPVTMCYSTSTNSSEHPLDLESNTFPTHQRPRTASELLKDRDLPFEELEESARFYSSQNRGLKLLFALYNLLAANSELVCYFIIVLNNMVTASVISLVLPILIFLWAMLAIPRPSKRFWMIAIVYTEVMVVVKYLFQFGFFPWNSYYDTKINEGKPFFPPRILGLEKTDNYIRYDLMQLLVLFFHRSLLRRYGLWDQDEGMAEKKKMAVEKSEDTEESCLKKVVKKPDEEAEICEAAAAKPVEDVESDKKQEDIVEHTLEEPIGKGEKQENLLRFRKNKRSSDEVSIVNEGAKPKMKVKEKRKDAASRKLRAIGKKLKLVMLTLIQNIYKPVIGFFNDILHTKYRAATDVYALMFLTDVVDFVIIVFGFWAFGKHSAAADIASTLSEDQVPEAFLVMLLIQFSTMVIDRALYLRKTVLGKLVFQVFLVFGIHFWMFFILPAVTERMFSQNPVAQLWYFVKCIYFALSAYQIRCGYPTRILGNFLTKKYNHLNLFLFQGFRLVPFLVELRAVMDWVWTDTTLSLSDWMCVEDIYANIFIIKCSRETEKKYPQPKGQKKKKIVKYGMGGLIIVFLICIIWFPLLFISLVRSVVGVVNHPVDVTVTVKLGGYEPLFTMSAQQQSIQPFTESNYDNLTKTFGTNPVAMQFITMYSYEDIVTANIEGSSGSVWRISPPSRLKMIEELRNSTADMTLRLMWTFQRDPGRGGTVENAFDKHSIDLKHNDPVRIQLASLLLGNDTNVVNVPHMFPNYIRAPNGADAKPVKQLYEDYEDSYLDVNLTLIKTQGSDSAGFQEWWDIHISDCDSSQEDCDVLPMVIFSDKISPPSLGFLAGYGIMGLYLSVVLVIGKFVRGFFSEISHSIMFEELPCVDRILKLCNDIFLVRETGELELEEELFSKLIFLYRSPETMIKWTREKD
ncbi:piezo-type mechanosensitive ion channel component 1 isoform X3 [Polypterus senegalus]|uniref:piezo-type mechanosensitive ion channel component 1 isoform X3 n=1 Tax=Polypterus senegalus TaxID=55291 RepID=UPI0019659F43|nr:piezo-type mechanosensitive ion channel component 1 isoform X3 [Polypterus senegalus]